jgi:hypothetical protein
MAVAVAAVAPAACGSPPERPPRVVQSAPTAVNQADIVRVRSALPDGHEVGDLQGPLSAAALWGFGSGWAATPPQCAALADPAPADRTARGLSASGPGGTLFVVVATAPAGAPAPEVLDQCGRWAMRFGHTTAEVTRTEGPAIEGAQTIAWQAQARTVVEAGSETTADAWTAIAYFDSHVAFVTLVTDPGSSDPPLESGFAAGLLDTTVATLRR